MKNTRKAMLRPLLVMGVLAAPTWLGGCGGSGHDNNTATSNSPLKAGDIVSENGTVTAVRDKIILSGPNGQPVYDYVINGDSGRVYEDFDMADAYKQNGLRVLFTATVVNVIASPVGEYQGIPVHVTQISKL